MPAPVQLGGRCTIGKGPSKPDRVVFSGAACGRNWTLCRSGNKTSAALRYCGNKTSAALRYCGTMARERLMQSSRKEAFWLFCVLCQHLPAAKLCPLPALARRQTVLWQ